MGGGGREGGRGGGWCDSDVDDAGDEDNGADSAAAGNLDVKDVQLH